MNQNVGHTERATLNHDRQYDRSDVGVLEGVAEAELQSEEWDASHLPEFSAL